PRRDHERGPDRRPRHPRGADLAPRRRHRRAAPERRLSRAPPDARRRLPRNDRRGDRSMTAIAAPLATLARRRFALTVRTPRELVVPLLTPVMFAVVIAPALKSAVGGLRGSNVDYEAFVALAT